MTQLVARLPADLVACVDALVADGVFASRSEAVRAGLALIVDRHRRAATARQIVEAYQRRPQTEDESGWVDEASVRMIAEEPW